MPFGAEVQADGTVKFRLWAPDATTVQLDLTHEHGHVGLPLQALGDGWFSTHLQQRVGAARYAFRIDDRLTVPDPASRFNPEDVHAPSQLVDPDAFEWTDGGWRGRPWEQAVIYELHVGTFTSEGTFAAVVEKLDYLASLGVTAIELMPVADFPGRRGWGYDGVLLFAPESSYGSPEDLKRLVMEAHHRGLMVFLDVVYNHFGPEGNYLHEIASPYFNPAHATPWGAAINFDGQGARPVRDYCVHNALYWIQEFHLDGLRLDAVHAIKDTGHPHIVEELAAAVRAGPGRERHVHLILENDSNETRFLRRAVNSLPGGGEMIVPVAADAQWNDDFHHALHVLATSERAGYYADYADRPLWYLGRTLAEGFGYQGDVSSYRNGKPRGDPSTHLPPTAFIIFTQSHDQVGNRAFGERIAQLARPEILRAGVMCLLLAPSIPMLFMGEEFNAGTPFHYFCDFSPELAEKVREGRRREFAELVRGSSIPDANAVETFAASKLDWRKVAAAGHRDRLELYRELLARRQRFIVPHLSGDRHTGTFQVHEGERLSVDWVLPDGARLSLRANFSASAWSPAASPGHEIYVSHPRGDHGALAPFGVAWRLDRHG